MIFDEQHAQLNCTHISIHKKEYLLCNKYIFNGIVYFLRLPRVVSNAIHIHALAVSPQKNEWMDV